MWLLMNQNTNRVLIVDCDYLYDSCGLRNFKAMKVSSYHKQKEEVVHLATPRDLTNYKSYDIIYVFKEKEKSYKLPSKLEALSNVFLMSDFYSEKARYIPYYSERIASLKPDYLLYPIELDNRNRKTWAQYWEFSYKGKRLERFQRPVNSYEKAKINYIVDDVFILPSTDILWIFNYINQEVKENNIVFMKKISLKRLLEEKIFEEFCNLKLYRAKLYFINDIGHDEESVETMIKLLDRIKARFSNSISHIAIRGLTFNPKLEDSSRKDLVRLIKISSSLRRNGYRVEVLLPKNYKEIPSHPYFELVRQWCLTKTSLTFAEAILGEEWQEKVNSIRYWDSTNVKLFLNIVKVLPELAAYVFPAEANLKYLSEMKNYI